LRRRSQSSADCVDLPGGKASSPGMAQTISGPPRSWMSRSCWGHAAGKECLYLRSLEGVYDIWDLQNGQISIWTMSVSRYRTPFKFPTDELFLCYTYVDGNNSNSDSIWGTTEVSNFLE
jgi:hypothetical protein